MCLATGNALLGLTMELNTRIGEISVPMLVIHGDADEIIDFKGSQELVEKAKANSIDATLSMYPGMLHAPLCELPEIRGKVEAEITAWIEARLKPGAPGPG